MYYSVIRGRNIFICGEIDQCLFDIDKGIDNKRNFNYLGNIHEVFPLDEITYIGLTKGCPIFILSQLY